MDWAGEKVQRIIPDRVLRAIDDALSVGLRKHPEAEWSSDLERIEYYGKVGRHLLAYMGGELIDPDDGHHPLTGVIIACCHLIDKDLKEVDNGKHRTI